MHDGERALGLRLPGRLGERQVHAQAVVAAGVDEGGRHSHRGLVGPHLHHGVHVDREAAHPGLGAAVHAGGPVVGGSDAGPRPDGAALVDPHGHGAGGVHERVLARRRIVVGIAQIAAVHQAPVARLAVECEGARDGVQVDAHQSVGQHDRPVGFAGLHRVGQRRRLERTPAVAGHVAGAGDDLAGRRLLHAHADHRVGSGT